MSRCKWVACRQWLMVVLLAALSMPVVAQTAQVQFINASGDRQVLFFDIYANGQLLVDDLRFNGATPYISVPTGLAVNVGIAPENSTGVQDTLKNIPTRFDTGAIYTAVLVGVPNPTNFAVNPDGKSIELDLVVRSGAQLSNVNPLQTEFRVVHAVTDAGRLNLETRGDSLNLVQDLGYGEISDYQGVPPLIYTTDVVPVDLPAFVLGTFSRNFSDFVSAPVTLVVTGFISRFSNNIGPSVKLLAVFPNGSIPDLFQRETVETSTDIARMQFLHGSPDPVAATVDIYLNDALIFNDVSYGTSTGFFSMRGEMPFTFGVAPATSTGPGDILRRFDVILEPRKRYTAAVIGVLNPTLFAPNPEGRSTALDLIVQEGAREMLAGVDQSEFNMIYAIPDAPTVDVFVQDLAVVGENVFYGTITDYAAVDNIAGHRLDFVPRGGNRIGRIIMDFTNVGRPVTLLATGFLNSVVGEPFDTFLFFTDGFSATDPLTVSVDTETDEPTSRFVLHGHAPNPVQSTTQLRFDLPEHARVGVRVYDVTGREVLALPEQWMGAGQDARLDLDMSHLAPGVYLYRFEATAPARSYRQSRALVKMN